MRWLQIAHQLPARTRLRTPVLRKDTPACERVVDALAAIPGVREVTVRPYTGSVLIEHDHRLAIGTLLDAACGVLAIDRVLATGEKPPPPAEVPPFSSIARKVVLAVREIDRDLRRGSEGTVDLGLLLTLGFATAGAAEVIGSGKLPLPPWFNLAWWGFRMFMVTEQPEIQAKEEDDEASND